MNKKMMVGIVSFILGFVFHPISYAAQEGDAAQQAAEQLKLLQQRLSQDKSTAQQATEAQTENKQKASAPRRRQVESADPSDNEDMVNDHSARLIDRKAFKDMTRNLFPLSPHQLKKLKHIYQSQEFAKAAPAGTPPKPTATSQMVNLSPGTTPPVIRLAQGFVSSLVFLDSTGAPWPITAYDLGDPTAFNIQWDKTSNTLMIQSLKLYQYGNLAVRLMGLNTPVMLTLIPGQKAVDYRVDLRIQGYGPKAKAPTMTHGIPPGANDILLKILDGVPPPNSARLKVTGGKAQAWMANNQMYVRTTLNILSPGWISSMTSADGTHAYEMQKSPVLLVSWHGKVMQLKVEGL